MRLAIHRREGSFSDRWISYCEKHRISYDSVNCLETDILGKLSLTDGLLWHWSHYDQREQLVARHVIRGAEKLGLVVFPSTSTCWDFDDKVAQKYSLEGVKAPLVPTYIFYDVGEALEWIDRACFPKVFKLRKGAGSSNVRLVRSRAVARRLATQAFSKGFNPIPAYWQDSGKRYRVARRNGDLLGIIKRLPSTLSRLRKMKHRMERERGYVYFQDFIPENQFDIRVTIVGSRGFAFTRGVRPGDFRASGSGNIRYDVGKIPLQCVQIAFDITEKFNSQSMAFDFVIAANHGPMIVEVSYCYDPKAVYQCDGYWDRELTWHAGHIWPEEAILADVLDHISQRKATYKALRRDA
jgi:glutathione synthase/RimK-type ligase-like ATP-grasp enzyme